MIDTRFPDSAAARTAFETQGVLEPGAEGWWRVWGASVRHIQPGDLVCSRDDDADDIDVDFVQDVYVAKNAPLRFGVILDGERVTFGALTRIFLLRWGTGNTLA